MPLHELDIMQAKLLLWMQGVVGEMELNQVRRRTTENKRALRESGKRVGEGGPIYGYRWKRREDGRIDPSRAWEIVEAEAEVMRHMYHWFGNLGWTVGRVIEELNARYDRGPGFEPPSVARGRKFADGRRPRWCRNIGKMIADPTYKGTALCDRTRHMGDGRYLRVPMDQQRVLGDSPTPTIVDADLWERANAQIAARRSPSFDPARQTAERRNLRQFAFFRGILRCNCCGSPMRVILMQQWDKKARKHTGPYRVAYRCERRWDKTLAPEQRACAGRPVHEDRMADPAWEAVVEAITRVGWMETKAAQLKAKRPGEEVLRDSLGMARENLAQTDRRIRNIVEQMADAEDPEDRADLKLKLASLRREQKGYAARIASLETKVQGYEQLDRRVDEIVRNVLAYRKRLIDPGKSTPAERRAIIDDLGIWFRGDGDWLELHLDTGLIDISPENGPLVVAEAPTRSGGGEDRRPGTLVIGNKATRSTIVPTR
jgi:hypothetical protein